MAKNSYETCPVCDYSLSEDEEKCPDCGAVLKLFDIDVDIDEGVSKETIEKVKSLILEREEDEELLEIIEEMDFSPIISEEADEEVEEVVTFACPICDSEVGENDSQCPNCGAIFEEESDEEDFESSVEDTSDMGPEEREVIPEKRDVDFQDDIDYYQKKIRRFENSDLDMKYLKEDLNELKKAQEEGNEQRGERILEQIQHDVESVENIMDIISKCENLLDILSEKIDVSELENRVKKIYQGCEIGEYEVAAKRGENIQKEIEKELTGFKEEKWLNDLIEEKGKKARDLISKMSPDFDIEHLEEEIDKALSLKEDKNIEERLQEVMEALSSASKISEISKKIEKAKEYLEDLKRIEIETSEYEEDIDDTINKIKKGEVKVAFEIITESIEDMQDALEQHKKDKEKQNQKELNEKMQKRITQIESLLEDIKKFDIETNEGEDMINEAGKFAEENEYQKGLSKLDEVEELYGEKVEEKINELIDSIRERTSKDLFEKEFPLNEIEELKTKGDYEKIVNLIESAEKNIGTQEELKKELTGRISRFEGIISSSKKFGFDMKDVKEGLQDAEKKIEKEDLSGAEEDIKRCEATIKKKLLNFLKRELKDAKKKLKKVDRDNIEINKPIGLLKDANQARKQNELEKSFDALKNYKEEMKKILENT